MRSKHFLGAAAVLGLALAGCGSNPAGSEASAQAAAATVSPAALGVGALGSEISATARLALGTLQLQGDLTPGAEQASQLRFLWQAYRGLLESETTAASEVESLSGQIRNTMSPDQLRAIDDMTFDSGEVAALLQELRAETVEGQSESRQGFGPGPGFTPAGVGAGGALLGPGGQGGGFPGGESGLAPEQIATVQANRAQRQANGDVLTRLLLTPLIDHLETLAGG